MKPDFLNLNPFAELLTRLGLNIITASLLVLGIYLRCCKKRTLMFSLFMFNIIIFIVGFVLSSTEVGFGTGLGLFAIFTMLRYRSETLNLREMTYLFIIITIGFVNSTRNITGFWTIVFLDLVVLVLIYFMEKYIGARALATEKIKYNNLEMLKPQYRHLLMQDIFRKTGIWAKAIDIDSISIADETASLTMYYDEKDSRKEALAGSANETGLPEAGEQSSRNHHGKLIKDEFILRISK